MQEPTLTNVTFPPDTVQTEGVVDAKLTGSPEVAVALTANGVVEKGRLASGAKAIVWLPAVTAKVWSTGAAAA
jgi:hypothetical protein